MIFRGGCKCFLAAIFHGRRKVRVLMVLTFACIVLKNLSKTFSLDVFHYSLLPRKMQALFSIFYWKSRIARERAKKNGSSRPISSGTVPENVFLMSFCHEFRDFVREVDRVLRQDALDQQRLRVEQVAVILEVLAVLARVMQSLQAREELVVRVDFEDARATGPLRRPQGRRRTT